VNSKITVKILKGMLEIVILELLSAKPMHGYAVISAIRKTYGVYFGPSTIYPLLNSMERRGLVKCEWMFNAKDRPKKVYYLTDEGKMFLHEGENSIKILVKPLLTSAKTA